MRSPLLALSGVSKRFEQPDGRPVEVLEDVSLSISAGEKLSLVGRSGTGKSTVLSLMCGLLVPDTGRVELRGVDLAGMDDSTRAAMRAESIGIALQSDNLIPFLTASENIALAMGFGPDRSRSPVRNRCGQLLERFGVAHRGGHLPRELSGGESQRVALAVALANDPALLLADEVVGQLDRNTAAQVVREVLEGDFAVVLVTHDETLADRVESRYELADGRVAPR